MTDVAKPAAPASRSAAQGILWMILTGLCFVAVTAIVKVLGGRVPAAQAAFLRYVMGLVFLAFMLPALRDVRLTARHWGLFTFRGIVHTLAVTLWFYAMSRIPIADVTAMNYLSPVYVTLLAALLLGEHLAARRLIAVLVALVGAFVILRPGFREVTEGHYAMLLTALLFAGSYLSAKVVADEVSPAVVVALLSIFVTIGLAPLAYAVWVPVSLPDIALLFAVACFATLGHFTMTLAFRAAPLTVTQPVTFLQLVWAVLLGALVFGEPVDGWVILGGAIIIASVTFISWREAVLKRKSVTPPINAPKL